MALSRMTKLRWDEEGEVWVEVPRAVPLLSRDDEDEKEVIVKREDEEKPPPLPAQIEPLPPPVQPIEVVPSPPGLWVLDWDEKEKEDEVTTTITEITPPTEARSTTTFTSTQTTPALANQPNTTITDLIRIFSPSRTPYALIMQENTPDYTFFQEFFLVTVVAVVTMLFIQHPPGFVHPIFKAPFSSLFEWVGSRDNKLAFSVTVGFRIG